MTQTFKKKALAVSIAAALFGGTAMAFAPAALANQFESSVVEPIAFVPIRAGAALTPLATAQANAKVAQVTLTATSATLAGKFRIQLPTSVQLVNSTTGAVIDLSLATNIGTAVNVLNTGIVVAGSTITPTAAVAYKSGSNITVEFTAPAGAVGGQVKLQAYLAAPAGTPAGDVNMTVVDGDSAAGATPIGLTGSTFKVTQIVSEEAIIAGDAPKTVIAGLTNQAAANVNITFTELLNVTGKEINVTLAGATYAVAPTCTILDPITHLATATTCFVTTAGLVTFAGAASVKPGDKLVISGISLDASSTAVGANVSATVNSSGANAIPNFGSATFNIATASGPGITTSYVDIAPTGFDTLYAGRQVQKVTDGVKIVESIPGSLTQNGVITYHLSTGRFSPAMTINSSDATVTCGTVPAGQALEALNCQVNSTPVTARSVVLTIPTSIGNVLDMRSATVGDLFANLSGTAGVTADIKIAEVIQATKSKVVDGGLIPAITYSVTNNNSGDLPDVTITENKIGALVPGGGNNILLVIDDGLQFQVANPPVVKVYNESGTELAGYVGASIFTPAGSGVITPLAAQRVVNIPLLLGSTAITGKLTVKVSGLKVLTVITSTGSATPIQDYNLTVTGSVAAADIAAGMQSDVGAKPWTESFRIASVVRDQGAMAKVTVTGPITAQTVIGQFAPPGQDQGKSGAVFVFGYIPQYVDFAPNTFWFFDNARNWHLYTDCDSAVPYFVGTLTSLNNIPVVGTPSDLTALLGSELYIGYGLGGIFDPRGVNAATCENMVLNSTYAKAMTVQ